MSELNRLLSIVVDVENLFMHVHKEEDPDIKQVYLYLFKVHIFFEYYKNGEKKNCQLWHYYAMFLPCLEKAK